MELDQLQVVKDILETGSVSKTAVRLQRSKSAISRQLAALEHECGGALFYRDGRGLLPTELGESLFPQIEIILSAAADIMRCKSAAAHDMIGEVRVTSTPTVSSILSERLFASLREKYPAIRLRVSEGFSLDIQSALDAGQTDIAVLLRSGAPDDRFESAICTLDTYLVGWPGDPLLQDDEIPFSALHKLPLIMPSSLNLARQAVEAAAAARGIKLSVVANLDSTGAGDTLLRARAGYRVIPIYTSASISSSPISADVRAGLLRASRIVDPEFMWTLVVRTGANMRPRVEAVARETVKILRGALGAPRLVSPRRD
jgi:LysR family transcriptional regulator, nitrogen assimilation regulatory protein